MSGVSIIVGDCGCTFAPLPPPPVFVAIHLFLLPRYKTLFSADLFISSCRCSFIVSVAVFL